MVDFRNMLPVIWEIHPTKVGVCMLLVPNIFLFCHQQTNIKQLLL